MKLVSIIVPAYNAEKTLESAINSLQLQSYENIEIVIINDGSWDSTAKIAEELKAHDKRINILSISNGGVSNARNTALKLCAGELVAFMDADDMMEPQIIYNLVSEFDDDKIDLATCGYKVISENEEIQFVQSPQRGRWKKEQLFEGIGNLQESKAFNMLWNKMFKLQIIKKYDIMMDVNLSMGEDFLFIVEYFEHMNGGMIIIEDTGYKYTLSRNGLQSTQNPDSCKRRIEQLNHLERLFEKRNYPLDYIYLEQLRCFYTSIVECKKTKVILQEIYQMNEYKILSKAKFACRKKFKIFLVILNCRFTVIIELAVQAFRWAKQVRGTSYEW